MLWFLYYNGYLTYSSFAFPHVCILGNEGGCIGSWFAIGIAILLQACLDRLDGCSLIRFYTAWVDVLTYHPYHFVRFFSISSRSSLLRLEKETVVTHLVIGFGRRLSEDGSKRPILDGIGDIDNLSVGCCLL